MTFTKYNIIVFSAIAALSGLVLGVGLRLQPLSGDVTRVGGFSENDFGWSGTEEGFDPPLAEPFVPGKHFDILVVGDSFSSRTSPDRQARFGEFWTDFLALRAHASVGVLEARLPQLEAVLTSVLRSRDPPRVLIFEFVERQLKDKIVAELPGCDQNVVPAPAAGSAPSFAAREISPQVRRRQRVTKTGWREALPAETLDFLSKAILRRAFGVNKTTIARVPLRDGPVFTSRISGDLLVTEDDFSKRGWTEDDWAAIRCRFVHLQNLVEASGGARFLLLVPPDKSSAYREFLPADYQTPDVQERLSSWRELHFLRLDIPLRTAIRSGVPDVYLPNDTHWGNTGAKLVADAVTAALLGRPEEKK